MKRLLIAAAVVLFVTPLVGEDSPLVAAAKKTNRDKKMSTIVITDETLKTSTGGHVTTTKIVYAPGFEENEVLRLSASLERASEHPLAHAIVAAAEERD